MWISIATFEYWRLPEITRDILTITRSHWWNTWALYVFPTGPCHEVLKPAGDWSIAMSAGSMSALDHAIGMFLNPGEAWRKTDWGCCPPGCTMEPETVNGHVGSLIPW